MTEADGWLVEDTRIAGKLAAGLGIKKSMRLLTDQTSDGQMTRYVQEIQNGQTLAVVTDGGCPVVSDPGARLADLCLEAGIEVKSIPGPSAVTTALAASGFYGQRFVFLGFLGRKAGAIRSELTPFVESPMTLVLFESMNRIDALLATAGETLGGRRVALCRELTKPFEQVWRGSLLEIPSEEEFPRKGELTVVIEGRRSESVTRRHGPEKPLPKRSSRPR